MKKRVNAINPTTQKKSIGCYDTKTNDVTFADNTTEHIRDLESVKVFEKGILLITKTKEDGNTN